MGLTLGDGLALATLFLGVFGTAIMAIVRLPANKNGSSTSTHIHGAPVRTDDANDARFMTKEMCAVFHEHNAESFRQVNENLKAIYDRLQALEKKEG